MSESPRRNSNGNESFVSKHESFEISGMPLGPLGCHVKINLRNDMFSFHFNKVKFWKLFSDSGKMGRTFQNSTLSYIIGNSHNYVFLLLRPILVLTLIFLVRTSQEERVCSFSVLVRMPLFLLMKHQFK